MITIYKRKSKFLLLIVLLCLSIPLQTLAAGRKGSLSSETQKQRESNPAGKQVEHNEGIVEEQKEKISNPEPDTSPAEQAQAKEDLNKMSQQIDSVQQILQHDANTSEASEGSTSISTFDPGTYSNAVAGFIGGTSGSEAVTFRMSLARLDNQSFPQVTDFDTFDTAVQEYGNTYGVM